MAEQVAVPDLTKAQLRDPWTQGSTSRTVSVPHKHQHDDGSTRIHEKRKKSTDRESENDDGFSSKNSSDNALREGRSSNILQPPLRHPLPKCCILSPSIANRYFPRESMPDHSLLLKYRRDGTILIVRQHDQQRIEPRAARSSSSTSSTAISSLGPNDVLLGRNNTALSHVGNAQLRAFCCRQRLAFAKASR
jgi:hypothetical protein